MLRPQAEENNRINFHEDYCSDLSTHKLNPIDPSVFLDELVDVPVVHPLRYHRTLLPF